MDPIWSQNSDAFKKSTDDELHSHFRIEQNGFLRFISVQNGKTKSLEHGIFEPILNRTLCGKVKGVNK